MVRADCGGCAGCSACCSGMGRSVVLDPLDMHRLAEGTGVGAETLLTENLELNVVDADQLTQIVDWFSDCFKVVGYDADESKYYDIEIKVNLNSFTFWVLQYSGCVEVLDIGRKGKNSYRNRIKETLRKASEKYEEN